MDHLWKLVWLGHWNTPWLLACTAMASSNRQAVTRCGFQALPGTVKPKKPTPLFTLCVFLCLFQTKLKKKKTKWNVLSWWHYIVSIRTWTLGDGYLSLSTTGMLYDDRNLSDSPFTMSAASRPAPGSWCSMPICCVCG